MISRFGTLFIGSVDLDNVGWAGTAANDRWVSDERIATIFDKLDQLALTVDRSGFDTLWLAEHHFQREGYEVIPNLLLEALHLCHITKQLKIGCAFNVLPMWHPLRIAEDYAVVDHRTKGRVIFGVGRGYHTREVETFGAPMLDNNANREFFEEQIEVLVKAFNEPSFSHRGKYYTIPPEIPYRGYTLKEISLVPRPRTTPVEIWQPIVSATPRGIEFMLDHGIKGMIGGGAGPGGANEKVVVAWCDALARRGRDTELGTDLCIGFGFWLADTEEQAIAEAQPWYEESMKFSAPLGFFPGLSEQQLKDLADPHRAPFAGLPTVADAVKAGSFFAGPPELVIEKLETVQAAYPGLEFVNMQCQNTAPGHIVREQLAWFGEAVMPRFKTGVQAPALV